MTCWKCCTSKVRLRSQRGSCNQRGGSWEPITCVGCSMPFWAMCGETVSKSSGCRECMSLWWLVYLWKSADMAPLSARCNDWWFVVGSMKLVAHSTGSFVQQSIIYFGRGGRGRLGGGPGQGGSWDGRCWACILNIDYNEWMNVWWMIYALYVDKCRTDKRSNMVLFLLTRMWKSSE